MAEENQSADASSEDEDSPPKIKNFPGRWDEIVNRLILITPWIAVAAVMGYLLYTGSVSTDIVFAGEIPADILGIALAGVMVFTYILALMKFYGVGPVSWFLKKLHNFAKNYNPPE